MVQESEQYPVIVQSRDCLEAQHHTGSDRELGTPAANPQQTSTKPNRKIKATKIQTKC